MLGSVHRLADELAECGRKNCLAHSATFGYIWLHLAPYRSLQTVSLTRAFQKMDSNDFEWFRSCIQRMATISRSSMYMLVSKTATVANFQLTN